MKTGTNLRILEFVSKNQPVSPKQIVNFLGFSEVATYKQLKKLIELKKIEKIGKPPKVFYKLTKSNSPEFGLNAKYS